MNSRLVNKHKNQDIFLVTSSIQKTWPTKNKIIFLGEWCLIFNQKKYWENLKYKVQTYHWDDRKKLNKDYHYLKEINEELLELLSMELNAIHGVNKSLRYWRILIGPWLLSFVQVLFDRWSMLNQALSENNIDRCMVLDNHLFDLVPENMADFAEQSNSDEWNESIYSELLKVFFKDKINIDLVEVNKKKILVDKNPTKAIKPTIKNIILKKIVALSRNFYSDNEYFFIDSLLSRKFELFLQLKLFQFPKIWGFEDNFIETTTLDMDKRNFCLIFRNKSDDFCEVLKYFIPKHLPKVYLESYKLYLNQSLRNSWPKKPKAIITGSVFKSDLNRFWIAEKTEEGIPLVVRQHGGAYGVCAFSSIEDHEHAIADIWLSWGWSNLKKNHIVPAGHFKYKKKKLKFNPQGNALVVGFSMVRQSYSVVSYPIAGQWSYYFNDQACFVSSLPQKLRDQLLIRVRSYDYGQCQFERWRELFPKIKIDSGESQMERLMEGCRIYIATYNATSFLEALNWNIPTIIFWNPKYNELNERSKVDFELLKSVGIFHETPESAAKQLLEVWDNIPIWWNDDSLQNVRENFCNNYVKSHAKPIEEVKKLLKKY